MNDHLARESVAQDNLPAPAPARLGRVTRGKGLENPSGREVALDAAAPVASLAHELEEHRGVEAWIAPAEYDGAYPTVENWRSSRVLVLDLDYYDAAGEHSATPAEARDRLAALMDSGALRASIGHLTPRGARAYYVLDQVVTDAEEWCRAAERVASHARAMLRGAGLHRAAESTPPLPGVAVDPASIRVAQRYFAPRATVDGNPRDATVRVLRLEPIGLSEVPEGPMAPRAKRAASQPADSGQGIIARVLAALEVQPGAKRNVRGVAIRCPYHNDRTPSAIVFADRGNLACSASSCGVQEGLRQWAASDEGRALIGDALADEATRGSPRHARGVRLEPPWPEALAEEAYHGLAGEIVRVIEPHTEASPAALLVQLLVAFGSAIGRSAHFKAEDDRHYANLYAVLVGKTSKARKGTSWGRVLRLFGEAAPEWAEDRVQSGLSSGEGLMLPLRDRDGDEEDGEEEIDKRLMVVEPEFATCLRAIEREGNILSAVVRQAWDSGRLQTLTKRSPMRVTGAHVSIVGNITRDELRRYLTETETANGFGNRFLWLCVERSKILPEGGSFRIEAHAGLIDRLSAAIRHAAQAGEMGRDAAAGGLWRDLYPDLSEGLPGLLGAVTARAEAQVMRLALVYALLDCAPAIGVSHLRAGLAVWRYAQASARYVFGDSVGDPLADELLAALRSGPDGLTRTQIRDLFGRNKDAGRIGAALATLARHGLARQASDPSGAGRPAERWLAGTTETSRPPASEEARTGSVVSVVSVVPPNATTGHEAVTLEEDPARWPQELWDEYMARSRCLMESGACPAGEALDRAEREIRDRYARRSA